MNLTSRQQFNQFPRRRLMQLLLPLLIEQVILVGVGFVDAIMLAAIAQDAYGAVSLVDMINHLIMQVFMALGTGGAIVAAQYLGKQDREGAQHTANQTGFFVLLVSCALMLLTLLSGGWLLRVIYPRVSGSIMGYSRLYFSLSALAYPAHALFYCGSSLLYAQSNSRSSMFASVVMYALKVLLNLLFIMVLKMGVLGIGLANLISRAVGAAIVTLILFQKQSPIHYQGPFDIRKLWRAEHRIFKVALPSGLENAAFLTGKLVIGTIIATLSASAIAANAACNTISVIINMPGSAINFAMVTVVGQCVGAGLFEEARYNAKRLMKLQYLANIGAALLVLLLLKPLLSILQLSPEATQMAVSIMTLYCVLSGLVEPTAFGLPNCLRAAGDNRYTMYAAMASMVVLRVGFSYLLVYGFGLGLHGIWYAMYLDWIGRSAFFLKRFGSGRWQQHRLV